MLFFLPLSHVLFLLLTPHFSSATDDVDAAAISQENQSATSRLCHRRLQDDPVVITNNFIKLGVRPSGGLFTVVELDDGNNTVGLRYISQDGSGEEIEGIAHGSPVEGWAVHINGQEEGRSDYDRGDVGLTSDSLQFPNGDDSAVISTATTEHDKLRVTHNFHDIGAITANLYEITVTLENIDNNPVHNLEYIRFTDFEVSPTVSRCRKKAFLFCFLFFHFSNHLFVFLLLLHIFIRTAFA